MVVDEPSPTPFEWNGLMVSKVLLLGLPQTLEFRGQKPTLLMSLAAASAVQIQPVLLKMLSRIPPGSVVASP